jgi:pimeloyl-ACP methyl ester carboxylesterase
MALEERWLESPRRLRYLVGGEGSPLLLCHGFLGSAENFETWFARLARRRTLIIPDLPGCGESPPLRGRHTCGALARALQPLIDEIGPERIDLGGLCLGAGVAMELLERNPSRVDRLILHTPLLEPGVVRRRFHLQVAAMTASGVFDGVSWLSRRRRVSDAYKRLVVEGADVDRAAAEANFRNQQRSVPRAAREWLRDGIRRDDTAALEAHPGDTLIIIASGDRILDRDRLRPLVAEMPRVHLACVEEAGHGWNENFVRRQLDLLEAFLEGRPLPDAGSATAAA